MAGFSSQTTTTSCVNYDKLLNESKPLFRPVLRSVGYNEG